MLPEDVQRIVAAIEPLDFVLDAGELPFDSEGPHARRVRRISKTDGPEVLSLDLVLLPPWLEEVWDSREVVEWEGRRISVVSRDSKEREMKKSDRRPPKVDMSPDAIDRRLREVSELRRLCLSLSRARRLGPAKSLREDWRALLQPAAASVANFP